MKKNNALSFLLLFCVTCVFAQTAAERQEITRNYDLNALAQLEQEYAASFAANKAEALALAAIYGWPEFKEIENGGQAELVGVLSSGEPIYYATENPQGAITTRTDRVHSGGGAGLDLNGENMVAGIWDGGRVRETHELIGGRATQVDGVVSISDHSTHVAGTMIGTGDVFSGNAKGMAPMASLLAHSFNDDEAEMTAAAASGLLVSNHSYGIPADNLPLWYLGYYDTNARDMDNIVYNAPYYLPVCSAGNDRQSGANTGDGGYDYLTDKSVAKNTIVCAAVVEVLNYTGPSSVIMSGFSSWGPTDDGRVKPDISAKGVNMLSSVGTSNTAYANFSGTSMATPNTSGSLLLLQQHYNNLNGNFMLSSTLRGLALHTVDEAGFNPGPDYRFGWGLLNIERAAEVITNNGTNSLIIEETLAQGDVYTITVQSDNINDLITSVTWTDPAGTPGPANNPDAFIPALVNDLDLRVSQDGGATFLPWKLNPANFNDAATNGDNIVDNIEKVEVNGASGEYIIRISHKGTITNTTQDFSLIVSGIDVEDFRVSSNEGEKLVCESELSATFVVDMLFEDGFTDSIDFTAEDLPAGTSATIVPSTLIASGSVVVTLTGIETLEAGSYQFKVVGTGTSQTVNLYPILKIAEGDLQPVNLVDPVDGAPAVPTNVVFDWDEIGGTDTVAYEFDLATDSSFATIIASVTTNETTTTVTDLEDGTEYFWRVKGSNDCDESDFSDTFSFTTTETLGIDQNAIAGLVVYPNPTASLLNVSAETQLSSIEVMNVLGQTLLRKEVEATQAQVDLSTLAVGNYFVRVQAENASTVIQIVKK
jgi:Subtilase family/Secretion system C-terminal sorting domain